MKATRFGEDGWLIETDDPIALAAAIPRSGLDDVVPGADCVLLRGPAGAVRAALSAIPTDAGPPQVPEHVSLPAVWDGPDLDDVAHASGLAVPEVVEALLATTFTVAFCGFAPGFGYMTGLDPRLHLPRRTRPRPSVPAGSIAIAAGYCAVYPTASPGGWHLVGSCAVALFDADAEPPALLRPGRRVRFA